MKIIERMFQIMNIKKIKSVEIADSLGIRKSVISSWKTRICNPPSEYIVRICELLDVDVMYFLTGKECYSHLPFDAISSNLPTEEEKIIKLYHSLNEKNQAKIEGMLELLCSEPDNKKQSEVPELLKVAREPATYKEGIDVTYPEETKIYIPMLGYIAAGQPIDLPDDYTFDDVVAMPCTKEAEQADFALQIKGDSMYPLIEDGDTILVKRQSTARDGQIVVASINNATTLKKFYQFPDRVELHAINIKYAPIIINNNYTDFRILGVKL